MHLLMTRYTTADADRVEASLPTAVDEALDRAASRTGVDRLPTGVTTEPAVVHVDAGVDDLAGSTVAVVRHHDLVELQVRVPWSTVDRERRSLAAAAFADGLGDVLAAA